MEGKRLGDKCRGEGAEAGAGAGCGDRLRGKRREKGQLGWTCWPWLMALPLQGMASIRRGWISSWRSSTMETGCTSSPRVTPGRGRGGWSWAQALGGVLISGENSVGVSGPHGGWRRACRIPCVWRSPNWGPATVGGGVDRGSPCVPQPTSLFSLPGKVNMSQEFMRFKWGECMGGGG